MKKDSRNTKSGFFLIEGMIALVAMTITIMSITRYQWYLYTQKITIDKQINLLYMIHDLCESKKYEHDTYGESVSGDGMITWRQLLKKQICNRNILITEMIMTYTINNKTCYHRFIIM